MNSPGLEYQYLRVDGHRIAYFDEGDGEPVLLIHGIPTSNQLWRDIIPPLAGDYRVIAPDMLNYGKSDKPLRADVSIAAQAEIMIGVMNALGIRRAHVVAHDIGGGVALIMAVKYPERIRKLAVSNTVCFDSWPIPEFQPLQKPEAEDAMDLQQFLKMMADFLPQGVYRPESLTETAKALMLEPWSNETGKRALFRNFRRLNPEYTQAIAEALPGMDIDTLILWGREDPFQKPVYAERLQQTLPRARLVWLEEAAHWLMEEKPEEVTHTLQAFLAD